MKQTLLTFITEVDPASAGALSRLLDEIATELLSNRYIPFPRLELLHFASFVLHDDPEYGSRLIFENNFDGPLDRYLGELYRHAAEGLHLIYRCCVGYPASSAAEREAILGYLKSHVVRPSAYHVGNVGRSAERIRAETRLRDRIEVFLDGVDRSNGAGVPVVIRQRVAQAVRAEPTLSLLEADEPRQTPWERVLPWLKIAAAVTAVVLVTLALPALVFVALAIFIVVLYRHEARDAVHGGAAQLQHVQALVLEEDRTPLVQNHMTSITNVKPGAFRRATLRTVLWIVNLVARTSTHGSLSGIPSIHFAHWSLIDGGRRLLFLSNYDGSWESYLDDFIEKASRGLTAIWSNTVEFPATKFLVFGGARDGPRFKAIARDKQSRTNVWYSAYPRLTVQAIDNQSAIREGLFRTLDETAVREWLAWL
jgi:hypothetical protein